MDRALQSATVEMLRQSYLFAGLLSDSLHRLAASSRIERRDKGSLIFLAGDDPDGLRVVRSGLVRIWISDDDGRELTLSLIETGGVFGELALLDGEPRSANASVQEDAVLVVLPRLAFEDMLRTDPDFARHLIRVLCGILRRNTDDLSGFAFYDLGMRLAAKLYELAQSHARLADGGAHFTRRFSQTELAQWLGATREAINKRLQAMTRDGLITIVDGHFVVPDLEALARMASDARRDAARP